MNHDEHTHYLANRFTTLVALVAFRGVAFAFGIGFLVFFLVGFVFVVGCFGFVVMVFGMHRMCRRNFLSAATAFSMNLVALSTYNGHVQMRTIHSLHSLVSNNAST